MHINIIYMLYVMYTYMTCNKYFTILHYTVHTCIQYTKSVLYSQSRCLYHPSTGSYIYLETVYILYLRTPLYMYSTRTTCVQFLRFYFHFFIIIIPGIEGTCTCGGTSIAVTVCIDKSKN